MYIYFSYFFTCQVWWIFYAHRKTYRKTVESPVNIGLRLWPSPFLDAYVWMKSLTLGCSWYRWRGLGLWLLFGLLAAVSRLLSFTFDTQETEYFHQQQIGNLSFLRQLKREKEPCDIHRTILFGGFSFFLRVNHGFIVQFGLCQSHFSI